MVLILTQKMIKQETKDFVDNPHTVMFVCDPHTVEMLNTHHYVCSTKEIYIF